MKSNKKLIIISVVSFFLISILGTLFHFAYEFLGGNVILGSIFAVNESVWEHLKILVMPMFICAIYEYILLKENRKNFFCALAFKIVISMLFVIGVFYSYTAILGKNVAVIDISTFYIAVFIAQLVWHNLIKNCQNLIIYRNISIVILIAILTLFLVFTYLPPKFELFKDNLNNSYGILR